MADRTGFGQGVREAPAPGFQVWDAHGRNLRIYLGADFLERLRAESFEALKSAPKRGAEIGGILLGRAETTGGRILLIENFVPVPCEYQNGPYYSLSNNDSLWFQAVLMKHRSIPQSPQAVIGYFRTHIRDSLFLHAEDLMLIRTHFSDPANVFLLIKPAADGGCTLGFFLWENGIVRSDPGYLEIASPTGAQSSPVPDRGLRVVKEATEPAAAVAPPAAMPRAQESKTTAITNRRGRFRTRAAVAGAFALAAGCAAFLALRDWRSAPPEPRPAMEKMEDPAAPPASPLSLQVEAKSGNLVLTWNRGAPQIRSARMALLSVRDGEFQKVVDLDMSQLRTGSIFYTPAGGDVEFRLEVFGDDNSRAVEAVRVLSARGDAMGAKRPAATVSAPVVISPAASAAFPARSGAAAMRQDASIPAPPRKFALPRAPQPESKLALADLPPHVTPAVATTLPSVEPTISANPPAPAAKPAAAAPPTPSAHTPPTPIRRLSPSLPQSIRGMLTQDVEMHVLVDIDAEGKVAKATALPNRSALSGHLGQAAAIAAKAWRFRPATDRGVNVPSQLTLTFLFTRQ